MVNNAINKYLYAVNIDILTSTTIQAFVHKLFYKQTNICRSETCININVNSQQTTKSI